MRPKIKTRQEWESFCMRRDMSNSQVPDILTDWKITNQGLLRALTDIRDIARSGLPSSGVTTEQSQQMKLNSIARNLTAMIDGLEQGEES